MPNPGTNPGELQARLETFRFANYNLRLQPLQTAEDLNRFWVEHDPDLLDELEQSITSSLETEKHLFTGHTGCGKSTLLAELRHRLDSRYFVVLFSVADLIEMADINHVNILFTIATQMMEVAEQKNIAIKPSTKKAFYRWFGHHTKVETSQLEASLDAGYEVGGGLNLGDLIAKFWVSLKGNMKANAVIREEIKTEFDRKISDLIGRINEIASVIQAECDRPILVIIDDLDKLNPDLAEKVYGNNIQPLSQPQFRIIYTIPIFVLRDVKLRKLLDASTDKIHTMRVSKFFAKGDSHRLHPTPVNPGLVKSFEDILDRRLSPDLIDPEIKYKLVLKSGGVLREMIRLASRCCDKCSVRLQRALRKSEAIAPVKIDAEILEQVLTDFQIEYDEPLGQKDYDLLKGIYDQGKPQDTENQRFLDLLHGLHILEYRNAKLWYDLNPIAIDLLRQEDVIPQPSEP